MANLSKEDVWKAINNAPSGMTSQEVLDGLVAQGHQIEGYTPQIPPNQSGPIGRMADAVTGLGKMAYSGYHQLADKFSDPSSPLYDEAISATLRALPGAVGVPESRLGLGLSALGGLAEFGTTKPLTEGIETAGKKIAQGIFQLGGQPAVKAKGAAENLESIANPENLNVLRGTYNSIMQKFGVQGLKDWLTSQGSKYPAATGDLQSAINEYTGSKAEKILTNPEEANLQDLHNIVDATSKRLDNPWAYPGPENARSNPTAMMKDLYQMKQDALEGMLKWGQKRVSDLQEALSPENLSNLSPDVAKTMQDAAPRMIADAQADTEALKQISGIRKQIFLSKTSSAMNRLTPANLNGSMNQLGALTQLGGAAGAAGELLAGNAPLAAIPAAVGIAKSPILGKGIVLGVRGAYNNLPQLDQTSQLFNALESQKDQNNAQ